MHTEKAWLGSLPWTEVQALNQALCKQQTTAYQPGKNFETARNLWDAAVSKPLSLHEVLDLCRKCYDISPFVFNNGNTFAGIARRVVDDWIQTMPAVEAQIIRNTIGHYVAGMISRRELEKVLRHFQTSWNAYALAHKMASKAAPMAVHEPLAKASPASAPPSSVVVQTQA